MQERTKKQFSLSMLVRVFLAIIVVVSLVVFANSVMRYNQLREEEAELQALVDELTLLKEELTVLAGSSEELSRILSDYAEYKKLINSDSEIGAHLAELEIKKAELMEFFNRAENKDYIIKQVKALGLYFPDEEIFFTNSND